MVARMVCCRVGADRRPPVSKRKRSSRRAASWSTDRSFTRAAANSIASGMPSNRRQILATTGQLWSVRPRSGRDDTARSSNRRTASDFRSCSSEADSPEPGSVSDLKRQSGLANAARTAKREQTRGSQQLPDNNLFLLAADEASQLRWKIVTCSHLPLGVLVPVLPLLKHVVYSLH